MLPVELSSLFLSSLFAGRLMARRSLCHRPTATALSSSLTTPSSARRTATQRSLASARASRIQSTQSSRLASPLLSASTSSRPSPHRRRRQHQRWRPRQHRHKHRWQRVQLQRQRQPTASPNLRSGASHRRSSPNDTYSHRIAVRELVHHTHCTRIHVREEWIHVREAKDQSSRRSSRRRSSFGRKACLSIHTGSSFQLFGADDGKDHDIDLRHKSTIKGPSDCIFAIAADLSEKSSVASEHGQSSPSPALSVCVTPLESVQSAIGSSACSGFNFFFHASLKRLLVLWVSSRLFSTLSS